MKDPNGKVVVFQWVVIAVLVIGAGIGGYMLYTKNTDLQSQLDSQSGNLSSLQNQIKEAKSSATPVPDGSALPPSSSNVATPTPSVSATPKATTSPKALAP